MFATPARTIAVHDRGCGAQHHIEEYVCHAVWHSCRKTTSVSPQCEGRGSTVVPVECQCVADCHERHAEIIGDGGSCGLQLIYKERTYSQDLRLSWNFAADTVCESRNDGDRVANATQPTRPCECGMYLTQRAGWVAVGSYGLASKPFLRIRSS